MTERVIEYKCRCEVCHGTGIYVGMAERDGSGIVCHSCKGSGYQEKTITYHDFDGRIRRGDVLRVFQSNPGIAVGKSKERGLTLRAFGGMPYKDWNSGKPFPLGSEMREFTCPAWWYQGVDYEMKPDWDECLGCGAFSSCDNFSTKSECWKRWDSEHATDHDGQKQ